MARQVCGKFDKRKYKDHVLLSTSYARRCFILVGLRFICHFPRHLLSLSLSPSLSHRLICYVVHFQAKKELATACSPACRGSCFIGAPALFGGRSQSSSAHFLLGMLLCPLAQHGGRKSCLHIDEHEYDCARLELLAFSLGSSGGNCRLDLPSVGW